MRSRALALCLSLFIPAAVAAQPTVRLQEVRFTGPSSVKELCACVLELRRDAEAHGRLDFTLEVERGGTSEAEILTARIRPGSGYAVGRIHFAGHTAIDDSTLRRAITIAERARLDVGQLRRSLARINQFGVFEPLTLADVAIVRHDDGVTADLTIPLRERKRRWWSVSGPLLPGVGTWRASLASRLPPWGLDLFEAATYFVSLNVAGFATPFLALQRPFIPGQELLSGFVISPALSSRAMLLHYGRAHLEPRMDAMLAGRRDEPFAVPVISAGIQESEPIVCVPAKPRLWWLRRGASVAADVALGALIP